MITQPRTIPAFGLAVMLVLASTALAQTPARFSTMPGDHRFDIALDGKPFATYVYLDPNIPRPFFCNIRAADGTPITRPHPAEPDDDHQDLHPGIWLAFGDIDGFDYWRNKSPIRHDRFIEQPKAEGDTLRFTVLNRYMGGERTVCLETGAVVLRAMPQGVLMEWTSTFRSDDGAFTFGDQEEMGLGFRLADPFTVDPGNGSFVTDTGLRNEAEVWGKTAKWCDYSGTANGIRYGIALLASPQNIRPCWMHSRDYGFLSANVFGENAMTGGPKNATRVEVSKELTLRYGLLIHWGPEGEVVDVEKVHDTYVQPTR